MARRIGDSIGRVTAHRARRKIKDTHGFLKMPLTAAAAPIPETVRQSARLLNFKKSNPATHRMHRARRNVNHVLSVVA